MRTVAAIAVAPVKGFALAHRDEVELTPDGPVENRRFFLVDGEGRRLRSSLTAWPVVVRGHYDAQADRLAMRFPDGQEVEASAVALGDTMTCEVSGRSIEVQVVEGPWEEPLSRLAGHPVHVVRPKAPATVFAEPVTLVSEASVHRLEREAGREVDARRFRMLLTLGGCEAHEEDTWNGRLVAVGEAVVRVGGPVPRCAVTTRDPDTGERDLDTLALIKSYRGVRDGEAIDFGVYGQVERPGKVRIGDQVEPL